MEHFKKWMLSKGYAVDTYFSYSSEKEVQNAFVIDYNYPATFTPAMLIGYMIEYCIEKHIITYIGLLNMGLFNSITEFYKFLEGIIERNTTGEIK